MNLHIDYPEARIIRSESLKWWAVLTEEERKIYCEANYPDRKHISLTGREIEKVYVTSKK